MTQPSITKGCLLSRRCWLVPVALWSLLIGAAFGWHLQSIERHAMDMAAERGRIIFQMMQLTRLWNARHGGVYVPVSEHTRPNPHLDEEERDLVTRDGRLLTKINPAYMTRQISELAGPEQFLLHITSLNPLRPANRADPWEHLALRAFEGGERSRTELVEVDGTQVFRHMEPLRVEPPCLDCHEKQGYHEGDVRGGISITLPAASILASLAHHRVSAQMLFGTAWLLVTGAMLLIFSRQRRLWIEEDRIRADQEVIIRERTTQLSEANRRLTEEAGERARAQHQAEEESQLLQTLIDGVAEPVMMIGADYRVERMNREARKYLPDHLDPADRPHCYRISHRRDAPCSGDDHPCPLTLARDARAPATATHCHHRPDGEARYVELLASPLWNADGSFRGVIESGHDITERMLAVEALRDAKERAEAANVAKSNFLTTVSHEIRTPLNAILGMADLLAETPLDDDQSHYVELFQHAGENLLELVNDILDLSRIEAGALTLNPAPLRLRETLERTVAILRPRAEAKGLTLEWRSDGPIPDVITADGVRLRQVLINLIGNAVKFTHGGEIAVEVAEVDATLRFSVIDTGIGIDEEKREAIFDAFIQSDSGSGRQYGGTGLGLAICRRMVEGWGGLIWAEENDRAAGSRFTFTLPLTPADALPESAAANAPATCSTRPLRVLAVDDAADNLFLIRAYLKSTPHHVTLAHSGKEAITLVREELFDLVLMDLQMPGMDGYQAAAAIREWERSEGHAPMPILALTAHAFAESAQRALAAGCDAHLTKPIKKAALLETLSHYAERVMEN